MIEYIHTLASTAREALPQLTRCQTGQKIAALYNAGQVIRNSIGDILAANAVDMQAAKEKNISAALLDRLMLNEARVEAIAQGLWTVADQPDPVGKVLATWYRPNGLTFERVAVPLGVVGVIYESRPNVTTDAAAITLMSGNAVILRSGSESIHSARALYTCLQAGLDHADLHPGCIQLVEHTDRACVGAMLGAQGLIDIIIPRGGKSLVARVQAEARVPVIAHLDGICHTYVDKSANLEMARKIILNAKMRRTGICGATETLLIDRNAPKEYARQLISDLMSAGCEVRVDPDLKDLHPNTVLAQDADWSTEYLAAIISVKYVDGVVGAVEHIARYSSQHTDAIIADDQIVAASFLKEVNSAIVMHNASTQFADGGEFGFGAEIGISTNRLPPRGPVGAEQLVTYKYVVRGNGTVRA
jgi:glutamate-5-semialdehyde dehydrogenase